jgi:hypothetical protein
MATIAVSLTQLGLVEQFRDRDLAVLDFGTLSSGWNWYPSAPGTRRSDRRFGSSRPTTKTSTIPRVS